jgi:hypothetical protein
VLSYDMCLTAADKKAVLLQDTSRTDLSRGRKTLKKFYAKVVRLSPSEDELNVAIISTPPQHVRPCL